MQNLPEIAQGLGRRAPEIAEEARGRRTTSPGLLGVSRGQLYSTMRRHGLTDARR